MSRGFTFVIACWLFMSVGQLTALGYTSATAGSSPCQFQTAAQPLNVALCESFDSPAGTGNRAGQLNGVLWGVSRTSSEDNPSQGLSDAWAPAQVDACGTARMVQPESDTVICNGQLVEGTNDNGNYTVLAMYPKQPFDIAGRIGTVTFDVTANSEGPHAAWPEFAYTDQPVPAPHHNEPAQTTYARNSFGFNLAMNGGPCTAVDTMYATRNYAYAPLAFRQLGCVQKSSDRTKLNHFEARISQSHVEVWGTDPGSTEKKEIASADNANLTLTRGLIWIEDAHYNADKFNDQAVHTFVWDNVGFDGPVLPRDLGFDVPDSLTSSQDGKARNLGYPFPDGTTPLKLGVPGVSNVSQASGAILTFNYFPYGVTSISYGINGHAWHTQPWPYADNGTYSWRTIALPVPLTEIQAGTNIVEIRPFDGGSVANVDLILQAAGGVHSPASEAASGAAVPVQSAPPSEAAPAAPPPGHAAVAHHHGAAAAGPPGLVTRLASVVRTHVWQALAVTAVLGLCLGAAIATIGVAWSRRRRQRLTPGQ